jgi:beta-lactamase class A
MEAPLTRRLAACLVLVALSAAGAEIPAKEAELWAKLRARVEAADRALDGVLGVSVRDLKTGAAIDIRADESFPTASAIKPAVLLELYHQAEAGRIDLLATTTPPAKRVLGGGVLQELGDRVTLTWRDLAVLMMAFSDNEATNVLIDKVGLDAVNRRLDTLGLPHTRLRRRMMDLEAARRGDENVSTPSELRRLMEAVREGIGLSPARATDLRAVASVPKWGTPPGQASAFRLPLPEGLRVLDKAGELEGVRCVTAVVDLAGRPYSVAVMTAYLGDDNDGKEAIRAISAALYETFDRLGRSSDLGRVISEK